MKSFLRHLREENDLEQVALASIAGTSQSYISDIESGRRPMTPSFAMKTGAVLGVDPVALLSAHELEKVVRKAEAGDPAAKNEALVLARRLLELVQEPDALDEEQAEQLRAIIAQLLRIVEGKPVGASRVAKPVPVEPVGKASADVMGTLRSLGAGRGVEVLAEDEVYARLEEAGLPVGTLEQLLDGASSMLADAQLSPEQRSAVENIYAAVLRRINDLGGDGGRSGFQTLAGADPRSGGGFRPSRSDAAAVKARYDAEVQEGRDHSQSMAELGYDAYGRPLSASKEAHDKALKSSPFLTETERETGCDLRGRPLDEQQLRRRRYIEQGD